MENQPKRTTKFLNLIRKRDYKILSTSLFLRGFSLQETVKCHPEVVEKCGKFPKCELNIYLAIPKRYNIIALVEKKLWKINQKGLQNF